MKKDLPLTTSNQIKSDKKIYTVHCSNRTSHTVAWCSG